MCYLPEELVASVHAQLAEPAVMGRYPSSLPSQWEDKHQVTSKSLSDSEIISNFLFMYLLLFFKIISGDGLIIVLSLCPLSEHYGF